MSTIALPVADQVGEVVSSMDGTVVRVHVMAGRPHVQLSAAAPSGLQTTALFTVAQARKILTYLDQPMSAKGCANLPGLPGAAFGCRKIPGEIGITVRCQRAVYTRLRDPEAALFRAVLSSAVSRANNKVVSRG
jgi:hypothetical protein